MEMAAHPRTIQRSICTLASSNRELLLTASTASASTAQVSIRDRVLGHAFDLDQAVAAGTARALRPHKRLLAA